MNLIYTIKTNDKTIYFHYLSKRLTDNLINITLTTTESRFLFNLCKNSISGVLVTSRTDMGNYIWEDEDVGIDRKANLNQLVCTLRKKLSNVTSNPLIITQPKKGYSLDDSIYVEQVSLDKIKNKLPKTSEEAVTEEFDTDNVTLNRIILSRSRVITLTALIVTCVNLYYFIFFNAPPMEKLSMANNLANGTRVIVFKNKDDVVSVNCIKENNENTEFVNYFIHGIRKEDMNYSWRVNTCGKL